MPNRGMLIRFFQTKTCIIIDQFKILSQSFREHNKVIELTVRTLLTTLYSIAHSKVALSVIITSVSTSLVSFSTFTLYFPFLQLRKTRKEKGEKKKKKRKRLS